MPPFHTPSHPLITEQWLKYNCVITQVYYLPCPVNLTGISRLLLSAFGQGYFSSGNFVNSGKGSKK